MIHFNSNFLENFLAVVRKYMQLRGGLTQKELSEMTNIGISTMSRFLNLKTSSIDEQLVANIIATLNIPINEIIDGVEEESAETFKRLVQFYKGQKLTDEANGKNLEGQKMSKPLKEKLESLTPRQKAYVNDFLNLASEDRDLIVDLGETMLKYFRARNLEI